MIPDPISPGTPASTNIQPPARRPGPFLAGGIVCGFIGGVLLVYLFPFFLIYFKMFMETMPKPLTRFYIGAITRWLT